MAFIKPDVVLSDGRELVIDLNKLSIREFRATLNPQQSEEDEYAAIGKTVGLTSQEVGDLSRDDYRRLARAWMKKATEPLAEPNP